MPQKVTPLPTSRRPLAAPGCVPAFVDAAAVQLQLGPFERVDLRGPSIEHRFAAGALTSSLQTGTFESLRRGPDEVPGEVVAHAVLNALGPFVRVKPGATEPEYEFTHGSIVDGKRGLRTSMTCWHANDSFVKRADHLGYGSMAGYSGSRQSWLYRDEGPGGWGGNLYTTNSGGGSVTGAVFTRVVRPDRRSEIQIKIEMPPEVATLALVRDDFGKFEDEIDRPDGTIEYTFASGRIVFDPQTQTIVSASAR